MDGFDTKTCWVDECSPSSELYYVKKTDAVESSQSDQRWL